jgi:amino acid adenylation domain-containing protein
LSAALADPDLPIADLPLMATDEVARMLVGQNDTAQPLPHGQRLHDPFEQWAARNPDAIAAVSPAGRHSFHELDTHANRIAHELRDLGVGRDARVALCLPRGVELLVATLAVLKAGGAFVPVDPGYPAARIDHMLGDSGARVLLTRSGVLPGAVTVPAAVTVLALDESAGRIAARPGEPPPCPAEPDDLCYVIYTSGSTGVPKGIALRHRGVLNNLLDLNHRFGVGVGDSVLALSSPSFDMSVYELIGVPGAGGTVVLSDERRLDPAHWLTLIAEHGVTVWNSVPAMLTLLIEEWEASRGPALASLRVALLGGDWIPVSLPDRLRAAAPRVRVISLGGATEASIHSTFHEIGAVDPTWTSIPYGRPLANQLAVILDDRLHPVPVGVAGNLYLGGIGLARGYLGAAAPANSRFVTCDLPGLGERRLYLTGDRARWRRTGELELIGRIDAQVKLNGVRIELGEVEAAIRSAPGVRAGAATVLRDEAGEPVLVGYVVPEQDGQLDLDLVRSDLADRLPAAMRPGRIVRLDALPLNPNGKVDRRALPWRGPDRPAGPPAPARDHPHASPAGPAGEMPLLRPLRRTPHADHTLVCLPYGGGGPGAYQPLADAVPVGVDVWSVHLPGHDRADHRPPVPLTAVLPACADEIARRITGPVTLFGHDAGAAAAVALAREMVARDRPVTATFVAAALPDADPLDSASSVIDQDDDELLDHLRSIGGFDGMFDDGDLGAVIGVVRHDLAEAVRFFLREQLGQNPPVRLAGSLHVVVGGADPATIGAEGRYREWEQYADAVTFTSIPGAGHYFIRHQPDELARIVVSRLEDSGRHAVAGSRDGTRTAAHA